MQMMKIHPPEDYMNFGVRPLEKYPLQVGTLHHQKARLVRALYPFKNNFINALHWGCIFCQDIILKPAAPLT